MGKKKGIIREGDDIVIPYSRGKISLPSGEYEFYCPKVRWGCKSCGSCCRVAAH